MMPAVCLISAAVILYHSLRAASRASYRTWAGPRWRFWILAGSFAAASAGSLGVALAVPGADALLVVGAAGYLASNRRNCIVEREDAPQ